LALIILTIRVTKIVKCPINTCTTLRNDDVIVTSLKNAVFARKETPERPEFVLPLLWPPNKDGFEDSMFEAKAKASSLRGQPRPVLLRGQGQGQFS